MKKKLTAKYINKLQPQEKYFKVWDTEISGFFIRVMPSGVKSYYVYYRHQGQGKEFLLGRHGKLTVTSARDAARKKLAEVTLGTDIQTQKKKSITATHKAQFETLEGFLNKKYKPWAEQNHKSYQETFRTLVRDFSHLNNRKLKDINQWDIQKWSTQKLKQGLKPTTINRRVKTLKAVLGKAKEWNVIEHNPIAGMKTLKTDSKPKVRYLEKNEEMRLRTTLDKRQDQQRKERIQFNQWRAERNLEPYPLLPTHTDHLKPIVLLAINTGMRQGEIFNLKWEHIELTKQSLMVLGETAKSGNTRYIPLNSEAMTVITTWKKEGQRSGYVFPSPKTGARLNNIRSSWAKVLKEAQIANFRFHDLRHHFASMLVMKGIDLNTVRELLGHSTLEMTLRYAHLAPENKAAAVALLNNIR